MDFQRSAHTSDRGSFQLAPPATPDQLQEAELAFRNVFAKASYTEPFSPSIESRLLVYPITYTTLDRPQFDAIAEASVRIGIDNAYLAGYGGENAGWGGTYGHQLIDLRLYDEYRSAEEVSSLEHFLFSPAGKWGLVTSDGEYALIGGSQAFIADIRRRLDYDEDAVVGSFVTEWREAGLAGASVGWVPILLDHVLGHGEGLRRWNEY